MGIGDDGWWEEGAGEGTERCQGRRDRRREAGTAFDRGEKKTTIPVCREPKLSHFCVTVDRAASVAPIAAASDDDIISR